MTRTDFKPRLPGYIATGLLILVTSFWTFWGVAEMWHEGWGMPFPHPLRYLVLGAVCLGFTLIALTWPRVGGWLLLAFGGAFGWAPDEEPIYYWSADEYDGEEAWYVPYNGGMLGYQPKEWGNPRHGYRCVREP